MASNLKLYAGFPLVFSMFFFNYCFGVYFTYIHIFFISPISSVLLIPVVLLMFPPQIIKRIANKIQFKDSQNIITIRGGSRRAEKSHKVLMMMKAAKLGWAGQEQAGSTLGAGQEQWKSREEARFGQEH